MPLKSIVAVVGTGDNIEPAITNARKLGELISQENWVVMSGGRDAGVMKAVNEGAKRANKECITVGIIPTAESQISPSVDIAIITDMNNARNNIIGLSGNVLVACGVDGPGTASEIALALKNGKKVILLGVDAAGVEFFQRLDKRDVLTASSPQDAINLIKSNKLC